MRVADGRIIAPAARIGASSAGSTAHPWSDDCR